MDLPRSARIVAFCVLCLTANVLVAPAEDAVPPPKKAEPVLKYDPEFPDSMVVATVNSEPITVGEVLEPYKRRIERVKNLRGTVVRYKTNPVTQESGWVSHPAPVSRGEWVKSLLGAVVGRKLRAQRLLADLSEKQRNALEEYLDTAWEEYAAELRKERGVSTMQELADKMKAEGTELASVKRTWRERSMAHQYDLLHKSSNYSPTRQELLQYYEEHKDEWRFPAKVKWHQIVVRPQSNESRESAQGRARNILDQLNRGAEFAELARKHSIGATRDEGGLWDWCDRDSPACQEDEEFLFNGKIGSTSDVIPYNDEFHIVRILDRRDAGALPFKKVEPEIRTALQKFHAVDELMKDAVITTVFGDDWTFEPSVP